MCKICKLKTLNEGDTFVFPKNPSVTYMVEGQYPSRKTTTIIRENKLSLPGIEPTGVEDGQTVQCAVPGKYSIRHSFIRN